ncbi:MAG: ABC transporter ATP-binding protein [Proteobacteria bacterium]|nr:ABC transporter ATP-binding protein [Pseudomonadota bacterium]
MKSEITTKSVFLYIVKMLKSFPGALFVMFTVAIVFAIDTSVKPYILKVIIDRATENSEQNVFQYLAIPSLCYLLMNFILATSWRIYDYFVQINMFPRLRAKIANESLGLLLDKSHNYFQNNFSGSLANKVNYLTGNVPDIVQIAIDRFFSHGLALIFAICTLWQVNIRFALFTLGWTVIFTIFAIFISKRLTVLADDWSEYGSIITGKVVDVLSNSLSVRLFSAKQSEKKSLSETFEATVKAEQKLQWSFFWMWVLYGYSFCMLLGVNLYFLLKGRQEGWVSIGDFALVLVLNVSIVDFLWEVARDFSQFTKYLGKITQSLKAILSDPEFVDATNATELSVSQGGIVFDNVKFHYKGNEALFQNTSVTIHPGQKVGLVGYSGGGKSTFVNLILRLYDVNDGRILIDDQNIKSVTQDSLRAAIGMIPQDPSLFHRSLMDNIRYGLVGASDAQVIEAAKRAYAHEFITRLPQGYDSLVGERGVKVSGGQRQRIAIARAILKNAPILILDEATSQLDSLTESDIQKSLWELMQGKTTIVIAHRLSTLLHMDRILVFDKGQIVEDGGCHELLERGGTFKNLWESQVGGFLLDERTE